MRGKAKWSIVLSLVLALSMFLTACSSGGNKTDKNKAGGDTNKSGGSKTEQLAANQTLNLAIGDDIPTMDWTQASDTTSTDAITNVTSGLVRMHNDKVTYDMAAGPPTVNADKTVYTYKLRDGIKWSDGSPVTAQDFVWGWQHENDPKTAAAYSWLFVSSNIKNADHIQTKGDPLYGKVDQLGIKALDDKTVQITVSKPTPFLNSVLSMACFMPAKKDFVEKQGKKYAQEPSNLLFNGPFVLAKWDHGKGWQLKKNPNYWNKDNIKLDTVNISVVKELNTRLNLYKTGSIDESPLSGDFIDQFKSSNAKEFHQGLTSFTSFLYLGQKQHPALANKDLRIAIDESINRDDFVNLVAKDGSFASHYAVPKKFVFGPDGKDFRSYAPDGFYKDDKADAKKHWDAAKKALGITSLNLELLTPDGDRYKKWDEYLANQISSTLDGIKVTINQQTWGEYLKLNDAGKYDIAFSGWSPDYRDPMTYLDMWTSDNSMNSTGWKDPKFDNLIKQAKNEGADPAKRWTAMQNAEKELLLQVPFAPLYQGGHAYVQKPYVKDLEFPLYGQNTDFTTTYILKH